MACACTLLRGQTRGVAARLVLIFQGGDDMKTSFSCLSLLCAVCVVLLAPRPGVLAQESGVMVPHRTIVGDLLMLDRDFYIVRGDRGEMQIEVTPQTDIAETFQSGDRIKADVLPNNKALAITRAGPDDVPGVMVHGASPSPGSAPDKANAVDKSVADVTLQGSMLSSSEVKRADGTRIVEGQILMVDGDFYVLRGERGEIRVERGPDTRMTETFKFGDFIKATVTQTDRALVIERLH